MDLEFLLHLLGDIEELWLELILLSCERSFVIVLSLFLMDIGAYEWIDWTFELWLIFDINGFSMLFVQFDLNLRDDSDFFFSMVFFNLINSYKGVDWGSLGISLFLELIVIWLIELLSFKELRDFIVLWIAAIPSSSSY